MYAITLGLGFMIQSKVIDAEDTRVTSPGDYLRILGRESDIINVGGEKVYAAEVESVLLEMDGVQDVAVAGRPVSIPLALSAWVPSGSVLGSIRTRPMSSAPWIRSRMVGSSSESGSSSCAP